MVLDLWMPGGEVGDPESLWLPQSARRPDPRELSANDWCWAIEEYDEERLGIGLRRIQEVRAYRMPSREPIVCARDLGPAEDFHAMPFTINTGAMEGRRIHSEYVTVGEAMHMADEYRDRPRPAWVQEDDESHAEQFMADLMVALDNPRSIL